MKGCMKILFIYFKVYLIVRTKLKNHNIYCIFITRSIKSKIFYSYFLQFKVEVFFLRIQYLLHNFFFFHQTLWLKNYIDKHCFLFLFQIATVIYLWCRNIVQENEFHFISLIFINVSLSFLHSFCDFYYWTYIFSTLIMDLTVLIIDFVYFGLFSFVKIFYYKNWFSNFYMHWTSCSY